MKRNNTIDLAKGVGIFLVILGHNPNPLTDYIYSFHMPLFFLLSGIFHSPEKECNKFFKKKLKNIIIPYILLSAILFIFWLIIGRNFGESRLKKTPVSHSLMGILLGTNIPGVSSIEWGTPLWFLPCLFVVSSLFFCISKINRKKIILFNFLFILSNIFLSKHLNIKLPWSILTALIAIPFYSFGYLFKERILDTQINTKYYIETFLLILFSIIAYKINGRVDMFGNSYKNLLIFFIGGFSGSLFLINFMKLIPQNKCKWITFLGVNSLLLLAFHGRALTLLKLILIVVLKKEFIEGDFLQAFIHSFFQILLCFPLILLINYCPTLFSKKLFR